MAALKIQVGRYPRVRWSSDSFFSLIYVILIWNDTTNVPNYEFLVSQSKIIAWDFGVFFSIFSLKNEVSGFCSWSSPGHPGSTWRPPRGLKTSKWLVEHIFECSERVIRGQSRPSLRFPKLRHLGYLRPQKFELGDIHVFVGARIVFSC